MSDAAVHAWAGGIMTFVIGSLIIGGVAAAGHHIAYWLAYVIAGVLVYGGFVLFDGDWID